MTRINPALFDRLRRKLGVGQSRVYALIQEKANSYHVRPHIGALVLAGENGISIRRYADPEDYAELPGHSRPHAPTAPAPPPALPRPAPRRKYGETKTKENTVFVVYGRDIKVRDAMYQFLSALRLKPEEWGHAIKAARRGRGGNPYVNDAVTKIMQQAQAIVVLLSPDDEAKLKEQFLSKEERRTEGKLRGQPRPNVIFETGVAIGAHHAKTVMLRVGDVKVAPFTDIGGMHIPHFSGDPKSRHDLANTLEDLGCDVNRDGDQWLTVGDFTPTPPKAKRKKRP